MASLPNTAVALIVLTLVATAASAPAPYTTPVIDADLEASEPPNAGAAAERTPKADHLLDLLPEFGGFASFTECDVTPATCAYCCRDCVLGDCEVSCDAGECASCNCDDLGEPTCTCKDIDRMILDIVEGGLPPSAHDRTGDAT
jgi:hypothetical protein